MLNILCLALGMATCLFIFNYVYFENNYDRFHQQSENIYRVETDTYFRQEITNTNAYSKYPTGENLTAQFQQVKDYTRLLPFSENGTAFIISIDKGESKRTSFVEKAYFSESSFFNIFSIDIIDKKEGGILSRPNTLAVSETTAQKLFPAKIKDRESIIGEEVQIRTTGENKETWVIEAIFKSLPNDSHLEFDALFSLVGRDYILNSPTQANTYTYLLMGDDYKAGMLKKDLVDKKKLSEYSYLDQDFLSLKAITDIHMSSRISNDPGTSANKTFMLFLIVLGVIILILASTNYINSAIINSIERSKEIGVRKLVGIQPKQLIANIFAESTSINLIAGLISLFFFVFGIRVVNLFSSVQYPVLFDIDTLLRSGLVVMGLVIFGALISGYYPASLLVSLKPIEALKGKTQIANSKQSNKGTRVMRILLIFQLTMSILFISAGYIVFNQLSYMKAKDNKTFRMSITAKFPGMMGANDYYAQQSDGFVKGLLQKGLIENATLSNLYNGQIRMKQRIKALHQVGGDTTRLIDEFDLFVIDHNYWAEAQDIFLAGENFDSRFGFDFNGVIINESAMKAMRFAIPDSAIGKAVRPYNGPLTIKAVIKNDSINDIPKVYVTGLRYPTYIDMVFETQGSSAEQLNSAVISANRLWGKQFKSIYFLTRKYEAQSALEKSLVNIFFFFTLLAVFIACLGIFGLSSFTALKRTKEIGIRKIMGANVSQILFILVYDFLLLMSYGSIVAIPLVIYGTRQWLMNYAYRINLQPWFVLGPIALMSSIAILIIIKQCWKTSIQSPIKALRIE